MIVTPLNGKYFNTNLNQCEVQIFVCITVTQGTNDLAVNDLLPVRHCMKTFFIS